MRNLEIGEIQEVNGASKQLSIVKDVVDIVNGIKSFFSGDSKPGSDQQPGSSKGTDAPGNKINCPSGTSADMGDHGDFMGPHCDRVI